ncbi:MAG TPA: radical SAM protein [bacterium]|nr:radical SAM protein [bacterium]
MFLHATTIYGPLTTRRLGTSLGINLLPVGRKVCNFECVYCECGWTDTSVKDVIPTLEEFTEALESKLSALRQQNQNIDHITFAGNGEPTLHPNFSAIIDTTREKRDKYFPNARIAVLTNATRVHKTEIFDALKKTDDPILKLDAGTETMFQRIDIPDKGISLDGITETLKKFNGNLIIQTLFLRGEHQNTVIDNTTPEEVHAWLRRIEAIKPRKVMVYPIDRDTPVKTLEKISATELEKIAAQVRTLGIPAEVFG